MSIIDKLKDSWMYTIAITVVSTSAITWGVVQNIVVSPIKDNLTRQSDRVRQLEDSIRQLMQQYDIPDSALYDIIKSANELPKTNEISTLNTIKQDSLDSIVTTKIRRNQTTQIDYPGFVITISTASVNPDGQTTLNIGYVVPISKFPESLQTKLSPAQTMTIMSSENAGNLKMFYIYLIASDPVGKSALIEVHLLQDLRNILMNSGTSTQNTP